MDNATEQINDETDAPEDWFGLIVEDDGTVWGIRYDGEEQYEFGKDDDLFRGLVAAGFPVQCDRQPWGDGHLFADFSFPPSLLPLVAVTAYSEGPPPREHDMGEAAVVVYNWLAKRPDVAEAARKSVSA